MAQRGTKSKGYEADSSVDASLTPRLLLNHVVDQLSGGFSYNF